MLTLKNMKEDIMETTSATRHATRPTRHALQHATSHATQEGPCNMRRNHAACAVRLYLLYL